METQELKEMTTDEKLNILLAKITALENEVELLKQHRSYESVITIGMNDAHKKFVDEQYKKLIGK